MSEYQFEGVTASAVANVYFDGKVISHSLFFADGSKKTLGLIFPGSYRFDTGAKENMVITRGSCRVRLQGEANFKTYSAGEDFDIPGNSAFDIAVDEGLAQYICSFG